MSKKVHCLTKSMFLLLAASILLTSCRKDEERPKSESEIKVQVSNFEQLRKFMAWSLGIPKDSLKFDDGTKEFYLPNTVVRESLKTVQDQYEKANIYRSEFENK